MATNDPNFQSFFPVTPETMTWENWNDELVIYYGQKNIVISPEETWKDAAMNIVQSQTFSRYPVPNPDNYDTWQDWANEFTTIINGRGA
jgi:hypothetical protein